jgi:GDP/UDP-N,N'-diacetylbacillosamine 2-epimerase (hydrolysing)
MAKSLGIFLSSFVDILSSIRPDWIVLAGDRGEQLMGAIAGAFCYIPLAHIQAGELSGNIDGMTRHAMGKYVHVHFASNRDAALRLKKMGEQEFRIHQVGAPQLDELVQGMYSSKEDLQEKFAIDLTQEYLLILQHPVTEEFGSAAEQIQVTLKALQKFDMTKIIIFPNNDAGSHMVREGIEKFKKGDVHVFSNLKREDFLGFMRNAACIVGNSSSGLLEAPTFKVPAVNIGRRQDGRIRGNNVIDVPLFEEGLIVKALRRAVSKKFRSYLAGHCTSPYGDGKTSQRIMRVLLDTPVDDKLLMKSLSY